MNIYMIVLIVYLGFLVWLGFRASKGQKETSEDYYVAGRKMSKWVVAGTYGASFMSAGTFLGQIGTNYQTGWVQTWNLCASMFAMFLMAALFTKKIWRVGYLYGVSSMPDLFGLRYPSKVTRGFYSVMILLIYIVGMAAMYIGIFTILSLVTSLSYMQCVIIGAVVVLLYSITGGAKAVAWTDDACMIIMFFSMVVAVFVALVHGGGFTNLVTAFGQAVTPEGKTWQQGAELFSSTTSYMTGGMCVAFFLTWSLGNITQPHQVTRALLAKDEHAALGGIALMIIPNCIILLSGQIIGAYARITYPDLARVDYAFPTVVMNALPSFIAAIVIVGIISAILSTASTMLVISSQCTGYDIYKKLVNPNASEKSVLKISRVTMVICSLLAIVVAYFAQTVSSILFLWSSAFAMMGAGVLPSLLGTFYWKRANSYGCLASMILGFGSTAAMYLWPALKPAWAVHPILPGLVLSIAAFVIVSLLTKAPDAETTEKFFGQAIRDPMKALPSR